MGKLKPPPLLMLMPLRTDLWCPTAAFRLSLPPPACGRRGMAAAPGLLSVFSQQLVYKDQVRAGG